MGIIILWVVCGIGAANIANNRGHSGCGWFLAGFLLGPLGFLLALTMSDRNQERVNRSNYEQQEDILEETRRHNRWKRRQWEEEQDQLQEERRRLRQLRMRQEDEWQDYLQEKRWRDKMLRNRLQDTIDNIEYERRNSQLPDRRNRQEALPYRELPEDQYWSDQDHNEYIDISHTSQYRYPEEDED